MASTGLELLTRQLKQSKRHGSDNQTGNSFGSCFVRWRGNGFALNVSDTEIESIYVVNKKERGAGDIFWACENCVTSMEASTLM